MLTLMELAHLVLLLVASTANLFLGFVAFLKNPSSRQHQLFATLTISLVLWTGANYVSLIAENPDTILLSVETILATVVLQNWLYLLFVANFLRNNPKLKRLNSKKLVGFYTGFSLVVAFLGAKGLFFNGYTLDGDSILPQATPFMAFFTVHALISILAAFILLIYFGRHSKGVLRNQARFLLLASGVLFVIVPATNFVLPVAFSITWFAYLTPVYTLTFAVIIAYTMVRHSLLDFRSVIARAAAYLLVLSSLAGVYLGLGYILTQAIMSISDNRELNEVTFLILAIVLALLITPLKQFFDKFSNRLFYRDAYEPQIFIDKLNKTVVSDIEVYSLLRKVSEVVKSNFKITFCEFVTINDQGKIVYVNNDLVGHQGLNVFELFYQDQVNHYHPIVVTDYLEDPAHQKLKDSLNQRDIGAMVSLIQQEDNTASQIRSIYMALGLKKSGNPYSGQDIRMLSITANTLGLAIQNALRFEEIASFNFTLQQKIEDATKELRRANEKLKALDETKDEFISMASHQLRTPLTSVKGYLSMVLEGDAGEIKKTQRQLLQQAFDSSQRMVYLISDLLNVSRLRTGKFILEAQPTNLSELVEAEVAQLKETASARGLKLSYEPHSGFPLLMLDDTKIRQVVMNFLDNAIYYTPSGGKITASVKATDEAVEYTVTDTGLGVPKKEQHHLFTKFYRAGNAKKARPDGTGLGLFMAKKVIVAHGGAIIFKSAEGKGSTFGFTFPRKKLETKP